MSTKGYVTAHLMKIVRQVRPTYDNTKMRETLERNGFKPIRTISGPSGRYTVRYWGKNAKQWVEAYVEAQKNPPAPAPAPTPAPAPLVNLEPLPLTDRVNAMAKQLDEVHAMVKKLVDELSGVEVQ